MSKKIEKKKEKKQVNKYLSDGKTKICAKCGQRQPVDQFSLDNSSKDKLWRFCRYCEYTRKHTDKPMTRKEWLARKSKPKATKKTTTKKKPKTVKKVAGVETIADIEKRITELSSTSSGLNIANPTKEIKAWAEEQGYGWESANVLYVGKRAE